MMENEHGRIDLLTQEQISWCNEHCDFDWFVGADEKIYTESSTLKFKNRDRLISFPVKFGDCENFNCSFCDRLISLKGAPKKANGYFKCIYCDLLKSLEGCPESIGEYFSCSFCRSLESFDGISKIVDVDLVFSGCYVLRSIDGLKNTEIGGEIIYNVCPKIEKYDSILKNANMFRMWQKSEYTADEFVKKWSGYLEAKKYGML